MNDRTLLELAAKAAGLKVRWNQESYYGPTMEIMEDESGGAPWNPLTDNGDALRLAVKLEIRIYTPQTKTMQYDIACAQNFDGEIDCCEKAEADPCAATRLAIVRAAASIGKEIP